MLKESFHHKFKHPFGIVLLILIAAGIYAYTQMKVELLPNVTFPKVKIIADNGEQPIDVMLVSVTKPLPVKNFIDAGRSPRSLTTSGRYLLPLMPN